VGCDARVDEKGFMESLLTPGIGFVTIYFPAGCLFTIHLLTETGRVGRGGMLSVMSFKAGNLSGLFVTLSASNG